MTVVPRWRRRLRAAGDTLIAILLQDSTRPLALFLALKLLALGGLMGLTVGTGTAPILGVPLWLWGAGFAAVGALMLAALLWEDAPPVVRAGATLLTLACWGLILTATAVRNPVAAGIYYFPDFVGLALVLWRVRPRRGGAGE